jgi:hypothetical protein
LTEAGFALIVPRMNADLGLLIQAIHDHPARAMIVTAGAGSQALADLLAVGGASRTLVEALIPYSTPSFDEFLSQQPEQYVAPATARLLAGRAYTRARWLEGLAAPLVGLSCTASITSDRPKRGEHRAHVAAWQPARLVEYNLHLEKGARNRIDEERLVSTLLVHALAVACGLLERPALPLGEGDGLEMRTYDYAVLAAALAHGERAWFGLSADGRIATAEETPQVVISGSFNPLHDGHLGLAEAASKMLGGLAPGELAFELAAVNVDKPPLPAATILERIAQFAGRHAVMVSNAPVYVQKARLYPGATFVIGYDTAVRLFDPRYYQGSRDAMFAAIDEIQTRGSRFLVAGRIDQAGVFHSLADIDIPPRYQPLFQAIPPELFRSDISSTQLRAAGVRGSR